MSKIMRNEKIDEISQFNFTFNSTIVAQLIPSSLHRLYNNKGNNTLLK